MASQRIVSWTAYGLVSALALKLVAVGFRAELAAILRLQMAARIVSVTGRGCATRKIVEVTLVCGTQKGWCLHFLLAFYLELT